MHPRGENPAAERDLRQREIRSLFKGKGMDYRIILLRPNYETAVQRTKTRTCHRSVTPEKWVRYFYDGLVFDDIEVLDNSNMTAAQAAQAIMVRS